MCQTITGEYPYLWRAVDQDGNVLDPLVHCRRDKQAAKPCCRQLLKSLPYVPRVISTDKLKSYGAATRAMLPGVEHRQHRSLNNRAENPTSPPASGSGACSGSNHRATLSGSSPLGPIAQHFRPRQQRVSAPAFRQELKNRFQIWQEVTP